MQGILSQGDTRLAMSRDARRRRLARQAGFTLTEMMVVVFIMALFMGVAAVGYDTVRKRGAVTRVQTDLREIGKALALYQDVMRALPTEQEGIEALVERPLGHRRAAYWDGPYLQKMPEDAWGFDYLYFQPGRSGEPYEIVSYGADGVPGGEGQDADWSSSDRF